MSALLALPRMTVDEFLGWAEGRDGRYELENGVVLAMSPEVNRHLSAKGEVFVALRNAVRSAGLPCTVLPDGATVRITSTTAFEPDALVYCGPPLPETATEFQPVIVVEVLSSGTARRDFTTKLTGYFQVASVQHYLIVDAEDRRVIHHRRGEGETVLTRIWTEGDLVLDPPGVVVRVTDLFPPLV